MRLVSLVFVVLSVFAGPAHSQGVPSLNDVRASLWASPQLSISGRQAEINPNEPGTAAKYEVFELEFDRPTGRIRMSGRRYRRGQPNADQFEVWGTIECANVLHIDESPAGDIRLSECVKASEIEAMLTTGWGIPMGASPVLGFLLEKAIGVGPGYSSNDKLAVNDDGRARTIVATNYAGATSFRAWFAPAWGAIEHFQVGDDTAPLRSTFTTQIASLSDADFHYQLSDEMRSLAAIKSVDDPASIAQLEALARSGSRRADIMLRMRTIGALMFGASRQSGFDVERAWSDLERLNELGLPLAMRMQGVLLAKGDMLPEALRALPKDQQVERGDALIWKAARLCDKESIDTLSKAYQPSMPGSPHGESFLKPNLAKLQELGRLQVECVDKLDAPELRAAAAEFADPFPH